MDFPRSREIDVAIHRGLSGALDAIRMGGGHVARFRAGVDVEAVMQGWRDGLGCRVLGGVDVRRWPARAGGTVELRSGSMICGYPVFFLDDPEMAGRLVLDVE